MTVEDFKRIDNIVTVGKLIDPIDSCASLIKAIEVATEYVQRNDINSEDDIKSHAKEHVSKLNKLSEDALTHYMALTVHFYNSFPHDFPRVVKDLLAHKEQLESEHVKPVGSC